MTPFTDRNERPTSAAAPSGSQADLSRQPEEAETTADSEPPATGGGGETTPSTASALQRDDDAAADTDAHRCAAAKDVGASSPGLGTGATTEAQSAPLAASRSPDADTSAGAHADIGADLEARPETREAGDGGPRSAMTISGDVDAAAVFHARPDAPAPEVAATSTSDWMDRQMDAMRDRVTDLTDDRDDGAASSLAGRLDDLMARADDLLGRSDAETGEPGGGFGSLISRADDLLSREPDASGDLGGTGSARLDEVQDRLDDLFASATAALSPGLKQAGDRDGDVSGDIMDRPSLLAALFDGDRADDETGPAAIIGDLASGLSDDDDDTLELVGDFWVPAFGDGPGSPDPFDNPGG